MALRLTEEQRAARERIAKAFGRPVDGAGDDERRVGALLFDLALSASAAVRGSTPDPYRKAGDGSGDEPGAVVRHSPAGRGPGDNSVEDAIAMKSEWMDATEKNVCLCCGQFVAKGRDGCTPDEFHLQLVLLEALGYTRDSLLGKHRAQVDFQLPGFAEWLQGQ